MFNNDQFIIGLGKLNQPFLTGQSFLFKQGIALLTALQLLADAHKSGDVFVSDKALNWYGGHLENLGFAEREIGPVHKFPCYRLTDEGKRFMGLIPVSMISLLPGWVNIVSPDENCRPLAINLADPAHYPLMVAFLDRGWLPENGIER